MRIAHQEINKIVTGDPDCAEHVFQCFFSWCMILVIIGDLFDLIEDDLLISDSGIAISLCRIWINDLSLFSRCSQIMKTFIL